MRGPADVAGPSSWSVHALPNRAVGAVQLLRHEGPARALHDRRGDRRQSGSGVRVRSSTAIYGLYTSMVYLLALPGGWVADKLWGQQRSVFVGGCIIALGHFTLAGPLIGLPLLPTFFAGLFFIIVGTGLLKPTVSSIVGQLYDVRARVLGQESPAEQKRDSGEVQT